MAERNNDDAAVTRLLKENLELTRENNRYLKKLHRDAVIGLWIRVLWVAVLVGIPFILYFYVIQPYFAAFGTSIEQIQLDISELPGFRVFRLIFPTGE